MKFTNFKVVFLKNAVFFTATFKAKRYSNRIISAPFGLLFIILLYAFISFTFQG